MSSPNRPSLGDRFRSLANGLRFGARTSLGFRRGPPRLVDEPKTDLFDYLEGEPRSLAEARERELRARYRLDPLWSCSTRLDYRENLYVLDALEVAYGGPRATRSGKGPLRVVDVGSKNFAYAFALDRFFRSDGRGASAPSVLGVELDGHVVYRDFRARRDHAEAYAAQTANPSVRYVVADFCDLNEGEFDVVTMFFPFVTRHALLRWGLPERHFTPERLFAKASEACARGELLVASQTEEERDATLLLASSVGLTVVSSRPLRSRLVHYHEVAAERFMTRLTRA